MPGPSLAAQAFRPLIVRAIVVPIIAIVLLVAVLVWQMWRLSTTAKWVEHTDQVIALTYALEKDHINLEAGLRGYMLTGDKTLLMPYENSLPRIEPGYDALIELTRDNDAQVERFRRTRALQRQWADYAKERVREIDGGRSQFDMQTISVGGGLMIEMRRRFDEIIGIEGGLRDARVAATRSLAGITMGIVCATAVILAAVLAIFSRRQLDMLSDQYELALNKVKDFNQTLEKKIDERTEQLRVSNDRLVDANRELEAFSYSVSHDLRAPMRHISGFADMLRRGLGDRLDADSAENLQTIRQTAKQAGTMVDDLLSFSRMGRTEMRETNVELKPMVETVISELAPELKGRDVQFTVGELPAAQGDPALLKMVFQNLISNAIKYTRKRTTAEIEIGSKLVDGQREFFVKDNGVGFDMRYVDKLFGVFQRLHRAEDFEGTGIGLANVRRIITRHGGVVRAEGIPENGATFAFTLGRQQQ